MKFYRKLLTAFLIFSGLPWTMIAQNPAQPYHNSYFLTVDSVKFHYRVWKPDSGPVKGKVLLVHGFCGSTYNFRNNYDALVSQGYQVIAIDLPGFGYSEREATLNQSQSNRSRLIWLLLDSIDQGNRDKWNIVGHSMGGGTVEAMALMRPDRTKSVTIVDGMMLMKNTLFYDAFFSISKTEPRKELLISYVKNNYLTFNNMSKKLKSAYGFKPDSALVNAYLNPLLIEGTAETIVNLIANSDPVDRLDQGRLKDFPVLVIWGKNDKTIPLRKGKKLKREIPSIQLKVIAGARHMPMETNPELFNKYFLDFLNANNR